jgi:UDP-N-acetylglucosamine 4-epimerase
MPSNFRLKNKRILITGGAGFIGSNLCEHFVLRGNQVICFDNLATGNENNIAHLRKKQNFTFLQGDIRNLDACLEVCEGTEIVMHQAALGSVPRSIEDPLTTNEVNVTGFLHMLEAARRKNVPRFIYAASSSAYGDIQSPIKVEGRIGSPLSPYAVSKLTNEKYADVFSRIYGMEVIGLRYFNVFGRRQDPNGAYAAAIPRFIKALINGESPVVYGDGEQTRDFTYIDNVIQANELAASTTNKKALNKVYNVAYGERTSVNELIAILKDLLSEFDSLIATIPSQHQPERKGDVRNSLASIKKAQKQLGYQPAYNLRKGLTKAIAWYWESLSDVKA